MAIPSRVAQDEIACACASIPSSCRSRSVLTRRYATHRVGSDLPVVERGLFIRSATALEGESAFYGGPVVERRERLTEFTAPRADLPGFAIEVPCSLVG